MSKPDNDESTQKVVTDLPAFIKPYVTRMLNRGEAASEIPYLRYPGERLAAITPTTRHGIDMIRGLAGLNPGTPSGRHAQEIPYVDIPDEFKTPAASSGKIAQLEQEIAGLRARLNQPPRYTRPYRSPTTSREGGQAGEGARDMDRGFAEPFQAGGPVTASFPELDEASAITSGVGGYRPNEITTARFDDAAAARYMSPYVTQVLDRLQGRVQDRYNRDLQGVYDQAAAAGAYGGTRAALQGEQLRENLFQELGDVEAEQMAAAYDRAGQLFTSDEERALDAAKATETARQGGAGIRLNAGQGLAGIQQMRQGLTLEQADALVRAGQLEQSQEQRGLDIAYEEFLRERGYDAEQARYLATLLGSVQYAPNSTTTAQQPGPNPANTVLGLGLAGLGAASGLGWAPFAATAAGAAAGG